MPKTLLAVDDSATMRKVLEITFGGDDFRVVTADGPSGALARMSEGPAAAVIDTSLVNEDGYALAKDLRSRDGRMAIVVLSSRYNPYDAGRARDAGVDDYIDKPFDTQTLIDKVKKALAARETRAAAPAVAPATSTFASGGPPRPQVSVPAGSPPAPGGKSWPTQRTHTLSFDGIPAIPAAPAAPGAPAFPRAAPSVVAPPAAPTAPAPAPAPPAASNVAAIANGHLAGKLDGLGLTPQQAEAVLALSREVVERVVWEVVPQLAEALIKEEITRLTKEG